MMAYGKKSLQGKIDARIISIFLPLVNESQHDSWRKISVGTQSLPVLDSIVFLCYNFCIMTRATGENKYKGWE